jgi:hypothetical protein
MAIQLLREMLSSSTADGSRTNALNHLQWMIAAFLAAILICAFRGVDKDVLFFFGAILVFLLAAYVITHFYFMVKNPDALRSEKFTIEKMAIERGLIGDSTSGMRQLGSGQKNVISLPVEGEKT